MSKIIDASEMKSVCDAGIFSNLENDIYHGQLTPEPSLSSSMARTLTDECPALLWARSYLNPDYVREEKAHFDIGSAVHLLYLEEEKFRDGVAVIDADDWRKKEAKEQRDAARDEKKIPLLKKTADEVFYMRQALLAHPVAGKAFAGEGFSELTVVWKDEPTGVWLKARPDWTPASFGFLVDLKTSTTANPRDFARKAYSYGYHRQAAWYLDALEAVTGERPKTFWFVVQNKSAPYLPVVSTFDEDAIEAGRRRNREAIDLFARCLETGNWPGYRDEATPDKDTAFLLTLPHWAQREVDEAVYSQAAD